MFISECLLQVFDKLKENYTAIELDQRDDGEEVQNILGEITGARTVSNIQFISRGVKTFQAIKVEIRIL